IGRVHLAHDSRIDRIEVDPITFQPGAATLAPEGQEQVTRLVTFLEHLPEVRMALTPVVSPADITAVKRQTVDAAIASAARASGVSPDEAAARLLKERLPAGPVPNAPDAVRAALVESEPAQPAMASGLAAQRVKTVRDIIAKAGVDPARLGQGSLVEGAAGAEPQVK